jgi:hypothetical protein
MVINMPPGGRRREPDSDTRRGPNSRIRVAPTAVARLVGSDLRIDERQLRLPARLRDVLRTESRDG